MGASVQFVGREAVLKAFRKMELPRWSLWPNSKDMLTSCVEADMADSERELDDWLTMIRGNTTGIFTLRLYDKSVKDIKPSTPHVYALNFRLSEDEARMGSAGGGGVPYGMEKLFGDMAARMEKIDKRLAEIEKEETEEPLAPWERMLENPVIMAGIGKVFNLDLSKVQVAEAVSGVPGQEAEDPVEILKRLDPDFGRRMAKLARIAISDLKKYKFFASMLDSQPG